MGIDVTAAKIKAQCIAWKNPCNEQAAHLIACFQLYSSSFD